jgi:NAD(P)-dependent dehydrogenase (short-subunit alcohol dehydrogenase family)
VSEPSTRPGTSLDGKAVVITGAARGLGRGYAMHLAERGARLVLNDLDEEVHEVCSEVRRSGGAAIALVGSATGWEFADHLMDVTVAEYGAVDGLVANAGVYHVARAVDETPEQIQASVHSNLVGTLHVGIQALRRMVSAGTGAIVTTTSSAADGLERASVYSAVKGAIVSLTYSWAIEVAGTGVRVNCVRPRALTRMSGLRGGARSEPRQPGEIAPLVAYLLEDRSTHLNGEVLGFDGETLSRLAPARPQVLAVGPEWNLETIAAAISTGTATS